MRRCATSAVTRNFRASSFPIANSAATTPFASPHYGPPSSSIKRPRTVTVPSRPQSTAGPSVGDEVPINYRATEQHPTLKEDDEYPSWLWCGHSSLLFRPTDPRTIT